MQMPVGEAGGDDRPLEVDHRGSGTGQRACLAVVAEQGDPPALRGERGVWQQSTCARIEQPGGEQDEIGGHGGSFRAVHGGGRRIAGRSGGVGGDGNREETATGRGSVGGTSGQPGCPPVAGGSARRLNAPTSRPSSRSAVVNAIRTTASGRSSSPMLASTPSPSRTTRI